jgi:hypothetical protein
MEGVMTKPRSQLKHRPNDGREFLTLVVRLAPPLDDAQELGMLGQKRHQITTLATLHGAAIVIEGAKHHRHRDALQGFAQDLGYLLTDRDQHGIEDQRGRDL